MFRPGFQVLVQHVVTLAVALLSPPATAQVWDGGGPNNNWSTPANWNPDAAPVNNGSAAVIFAGSTRLAPSVNIAQDVFSLTFDNTSGPFNLTGPAVLTIGNGGITNNDADTQTLAAGLALSAAQTWNATSGPLAFTGPSAVFLTPATLTVTGAFDTTITAALTGNGSLVKNGSGMLTLSGPSTFDAVFTINTGVVSLAGSSERLADTLDVTLAGAATLRLNGLTETIDSLSGGGAVQLGGGTLIVGAGNSTATFGGVISGAGGLTKTGGGTFTLSSAHTYDGVTNVLNGTLRLGAAQRLASTSSLLVNGGAFDVAAFAQTLTAVTLIDGTLTGSGSLTASTFEVRSGFVSARLDGTAGLTKSTADTVILAAANTYTGPTIVQGGTLQLSGSERIAYPSDLVIDGGTFALAGHAETVDVVHLLNGSITGPGTLTTDALTLELGTVAANIAGAVSPQKVGSGIAEISAPCSYSGTTSILAGTLRLGSSNVLPDATTLSLSSPATFALNDHSDTIAAIVVPIGASVALGGGTLSLASSTADSTIDGQITGSGGLTKAGSRTLLFNTAAAYTGLTTINAGTLRLGASHRLNDASTLTVAGGALDLQTFTETIAGLQLTGGSIIGTGTLTAGTFDLRSGTIAAALTGPALLLKSTPGLVTLSNTNSYTGGTRITGGTLAVSADAALGASAAAVTLDGGGLRFTGPVDSDRPITLASGGGTIETLAPTILGNLQSTGGALTKSGADVLILDAGPLPLGGLTVTAGELRIAASTLPAIAGSLAVSPPATLRLEGSPASATTISNSGQLELRDGAQLSGPLTNDGLIFGHGTLAGSLTNLAAGELDIAATESLTLGGPTLNNAGLIALLGGTLRANALLNNQSGGLIAGHGVIRCDAGLANAATAAFSGDTDVLGDITNNPGGRLITSGGATTTFFDDVVHNGIDIRTAAGSATVFFGALTGAGPLTGTGINYIEGDLRPGNSPGRVTVAGDLILGSLASLEMEIGGPTPGPQHDQLAIAGHAALDGTLQITFINGFDPQPGAEFTLITFGTRTGTFATVDLPPLPGRTLEIETTATTLRLRVTTGSSPARGDANCDGSIDFFDIDPFLLALFDLTAYQSNYCNGSTATADADCSANIDFFDIDPFLACLFGACPPCP